MSKIRINEQIIHFTISDNTELQLHIYHPEQLQELDPIVLVHGLHSSSQIFDVPCAENYSLARYLCRAGYLVITFDHRGSGGSKTNAWNFGLSELAFKDLPVVIDYALNESGADQVILGGHSLGGTTSYLLRAYLNKPGRSLRGLAKENLGKSFTIASPMRLSPNLFPYSRINQKREQLRELFEKDKNGIIPLERFMQGQILLFNSILGKNAPLGLIRKSLELSARNLLFANLIRLTSSPVLFYHRSDFNSHTFYALARSRAMGSGSSRLMLELIDIIESEGIINAKYKDDNVHLSKYFESDDHVRPLVISSLGDRLVPHQDATAIYKSPKSNPIIITDERYSIKCGHVGYLFKPDLYLRVYNDILRFLQGTNTFSKMR